jgi:hypothetical protein
VSVLCPAFIPTGIANSERNRPLTAAGATSSGGVSEDVPTSASGADGHLAEASRKANRKYARGLVQAVQSGKKTADDIAEHVFEAMERGDFYIVPHKKILGACALRFDDIKNLRQPTSIVPE